jgi:hypothetical protein
MAVLKAMERWSPALAGRTIYIASDNTNVVSGLFKQTVRGNAMAPLCTLLLHAARWDIEIIPYWIPSATNVLADALSRHEWDTIANLAPKLSQASLTMKRNTSTKHRGPS